MGDAGYAGVAMSQKDFGNNLCNEPDVGDAGDAGDAGVAMSQKDFG